MSFMSSYKRLDHLCHDIYPYARNGVSGYIENMENRPRGAFQVRGWDEDYKMLKHYRWIRNQIAHEEYAEEETMCKPEDIDWLDNFYLRIMNRTDPIALARQASQPRKPTYPTPPMQPRYFPAPYREESFYTPGQPVPPMRPSYPPAPAHKPHRAGNAVAIAAALAALIVVAVALCVTIFLLLAL